MESILAYFAKKKKRALITTQQKDKGTQKGQREKVESTCHLNLHITREVLNLSKTKLSFCVRACLCMLVYAYSEVCIPVCACLCGGECACVFVFLAQRAKAKEKSSVTNTAQNR